MTMNMEAIRGVQWFYVQHGTNFGLKGPSSELDDDVTFSIDTNTDDLQHQRDRLVMDIARYVFFATNWPQAAASADMLEDNVRRGYRYNMWQDPDALRV
jgi:hypothetical protein